MTDMYAPPDSSTSRQSLVRIAVIGISLVVLLLGVFVIAKQGQSKGIFAESLQERKARLDREKEAARLTEEEAQQKIKSAAAAQAAAQAKAAEEQAQAEQA